MRPVLVAFALAGCTSGTPGDTDTASPPDTTGTTGTTPTTGNYATEGTTDGGTYTVSYSSDPDPIPLNDYFTLTFSVFTDEAMTAPATGVSVAFDAGMPEHGHGMNVVPEITDNLDGTWTADPVLFHMEGHWQMTVNVIDTNGSETALFDTECCTVTE